MHKFKYLMENSEEIHRLEMKTDAALVEKQSKWAGIKPGMRVADIGCGSGKTSAILFEQVNPSGSVLGIDSSEERIEHATKLYAKQGAQFQCRDISASLDNLGAFDFVWVRFVLEYYRRNGFDMVKNLSTIVKPGGILCLIDLDFNCICHSGLSKRLENALLYATKILEEKANFDPYMGRRLYSFMYDLGYRDIDVEVTAYHQIFGELKEVDAFNWMKKLEVLETVSKTLNLHFDEYAGGFEEFKSEFCDFFADPRRFTYTPVISCRGVKPFTDS